MRPGRCLPACTPAAQRVLLSDWLSQRRKCGTAGQGWQVVSCPRDLRPMANPDYPRTSSHPSHPHPRRTHRHNGISALSTATRYEGEGSTMAGSCQGRLPRQQMPLGRLLAARRRYFFCRCPRRRESCPGPRRARSAPIREIQGALQGTRAAPLLHRPRRLHSPYAVPLGHSPACSGQDREGRPPRQPSAVCF